VKAHACFLCTTASTIVAYRRQKASKAAKEAIMLGWALTFFIIAIVAAIFGFGGIAAGAAGIAKILFFIFLILFLVSAVAHALRGRPPV